MKTELLYYDDVNKLNFDAKIISKKQVDDKFHITLDRTLFYPETGGMNSDIGYLNEAKVTHVKQKGNEVIHIVEQDILSDDIVGIVDQKQRFRNIQNHDAQHILTSLLIKDYNLKTVSEYAHESYCYIDLKGLELNDDILNDIEKKANKLIIENRKVDILFIDKKDFNKYGIADNPIYSDPARITNIEGVNDYNACACLHFSSLGPVQAIKCLGFDKHKEGFRMYYVAGEQLLDYLEDLYSTNLQIKESLSVKSNEIIKEVISIKNKNQDIQNELTKLKEKFYALELAQLITCCDDGFIFYENSDADLKDLKVLASLIQNSVAPLKAILQTNSSDRFQFILVTSQASDFNLMDFFNKLRNEYNLNGGKKGGMITGQSEFNVIEIIKKSI